MKIYTAKTDVSATKKIVVDDMFLTKNLPTTAGSKMLDGYKSLFDAEVITRLENSGFAISGKADVGEFAFDVIGETSYNGFKTTNACAEILNGEDVYATLNLDVNGYPRRVASQNGLISIKPTYGTVSRYGTIPVACSGETVSVMSKSTKNLKDVLYSIVGHDDKDGTSHSESVCQSVINNPSELNFKKVAILKSMLSVDDGVKGKLNGVLDCLKANGVEVVEIDDSVIKMARNAWNILMSSELTNNVSRYDGVKYGYRANYFTNIDELYTNSRTEAFGELLKFAILYGSDNLSTENYFKVYDKALRVRRVIAQKFNELFKEFDAVIIPSCSTLNYTEEMLKDKGFSYTENFFTAPASITGLPCVALEGVQFIGKAFSENALINLAEIIEKGGKN